MNEDLTKNASSSETLALNEWRNLLGAEHVLNSETILNQYSRTTGAIGTRPLAILRPITTEEVQEIVRIASRHKLALYPISRGKNYGYGDACAATNGQVIIDFKRMNRILQTNTRLGYVVIEPGVTQGQLSKYLKTHATGLWMDATGAGPEASLIGNALERGYGHTHYGNHTHTMCGLQLVLADGNILGTGFGQFQNAKSKHVYTSGLGPSLDGLFTQSNLGIVTQMGLWLSPEPEDFCAFLCWVENDDDLFKVIDILSSLKLRGVLQSTVHIGNDLRVISSRGRFPWDVADENKAMPEDIRSALRNKYGAKKWAFTGAIYGTKHHVKAARKTLTTELAPRKLNFLTDRLFNNVETLQKILAYVGLEKIKWLQSLQDKINTAKPLFELLKGNPTTETLRGAAWKTKGELSDPYEPLAAGSGILWQAPVLPATSENVKEILSLLEPVYHKHGFDCPMTFAMINDRALCCVTNVSFDKKNMEETGRALQCHTELSQILAEHGYYPYRTSAQGTAKLHQISSPYWDVVSKIKKALDPENILSPGHYIPDK